MSDLFQNAPPYIQALIAGIITWFAAAVFIFKKVNDKVLNSMQVCSWNHDSSKFLVIVTTRN